MSWSARVGPVFEAQDTDLSQKFPILRKLAGASNEAAPCSAGPWGGGARLEQGMVC